MFVCTTPNGLTNDLSRREMGQLKKSDAPASAANPIPTTNVIVMSFECIMCLPML